MTVRAAGSGTTTLVQLITPFWDVTGGRGRRVTDRGTHDELMEPGGR